MTKVIIYKDDKLIKVIEGGCVAGVMTDPKIPAEGSPFQADGETFLVGCAVPESVAKNLAHAAYAILKAAAGEEDILTDILALEFTEAFGDAVRGGVEEHIIQNVRTPAGNCTA